MGVSKRTVRRWETGETPMPRTAEILLARLRIEK
jgi:DNA-binding transcriptional regulator YiaG